MDREITLTPTEADAIFEILNDVVVSLDRIGSREAAGEDPEHNWINDYFGSGGATRRLSYARRLLTQAFHRTYSEGELDTMWGERDWPAWGRPTAPTTIPTVEDDL